MTPDGKEVPPVDLLGDTVDERYPIHKKEVETQTHILVLRVYLLWQ